MLAENWILYSKKEGKAASCREEESLCKKNGASLKGIHLQT